VNKKFMFSMKAIVILLVLILSGNQLTTVGLDLASANGLYDTQSSGETIVVTSAADSGPGSLRQALRDAQSGDTITFDPTVFPPASPATILLKTEDGDSALPNIDRGDLTIDASNAGVILDGSEIQGDSVNGLEIYSNRNTVRGLHIINFTGSGIALCGGSHNMIGGNPIIGAGPLGQGNLSSNNNIGIDLCAQESFATVTGNMIGTDPTGAMDWGNQFCGICVENGVHDTTIGPDNIVAHNEYTGVLVDGTEALGNAITQNSIHDNKGTGIELRDGGNTMLDSPLISDFDIAAGTVSGTACANCTVEIFSDTGDQGEIYEGRIKANSAGAFSLSKGTSFSGPHLTCTATDGQGNTSEFSEPTQFTKSSVLQVGNHLPKTSIQPKKSSELEDNHIGGMAGGLTGGGWQPGDPWDYVGMSNKVVGLGLKRFRVSINNLDAHNVDWSVPEFYVDPTHNALITLLADNDVTMTYVLSFWDKVTYPGGEGAPCPRFKTEGEIQRYLDFVQFIVHHFKDRIQYYEIWNEPNWSGCPQWIEVTDYINLVKRAAPIIRKEYPEAKLVVGGTTYFGGLDSRDYLFSILRSDIMPLVDVVSWHPMYGTSPEFDSQYYYDYPAIVQEIKDVSSAHGFQGEYEADELTWFTVDGEFWDGWSRRYTDMVAAKYQARGIVMHRGADVTVGIGSALIFDTSWVTIPFAIRNLCTVMSGAGVTDLPAEIEIVAPNILSSTFSLPNGDNLVALWTDGAAVDDDPGIPTMLTIPRITEHTVIGIDVVHGFQQQMITSEEDGNLVIRDLLIKDYPIIFRVTPTKYVFLPTVLKGPSP
jgi:hypothetical protein